MSLSAYRDKLCKDMSLRGGKARNILIMVRLMLRNLFFPEKERFQLPPHTRISKGRQQFRVEILMQDCFSTFYFSVQR